VLLCETRQLDNISCVDMSRFGPIARCPTRSECSCPNGYSHRQNVTMARCENYDAVVHDDVASEKEQPCLDVPANVLNFCVSDPYAFGIQLDEPALRT
jgi:hypothetical protein